MPPSQPVRDAVPVGDLALREQRLDDLAHQIDVEGSVADANAPALERRVEAALAAGVRWLIVDLRGADPVGDAALRVLSGGMRELRARRGELIVADAPPDVGPRLQGYDAADRPALAADVDQAVMILKMLRPKTAAARPAPRRRA